MIRLAMLTISMVLVTTWAGGAAPPCQADVKKLCADAPGAGGKVQACLKAHEADLSQACKTKVDEIGHWTGPLAAPCRYDIVHLCSEPAPGGGRIASCLKGKAADLTSECKERLEKASTP
jgi:hypothetical protein